MSASDRLRQAIEALPEDQRKGRWISDAGQVVPHPNAASYWADGNAWTMDYIALMDPTVGAALADLLDAIRGDKIDWRALHGDAASAAWKRHVFDARDFLEQAITREAS